MNVYRYHAIDETPDKHCKLKLIFASLLFWLGVTFSGVYYAPSLSSLANFAVPYPKAAIDILKPEAAKDYLEWEYEEAPTSMRLPNGTFTTYTVNLFAHPKIVKVFTEQTIAVRYQCEGPDYNIQVWKNENLVQGDLLPFEGYNVFDLDCRDLKGNSLIAFLVVMGMDGEVAAVHIPPHRAESVTMYSTDVVIFSCGMEGAFLWNWKDDSVKQLPFLAGAQTLSYRASDNKFYGLYLDTEGNPPVTAVGFDAETGEYEWGFEPEESRINYISVYGNYAYLSLKTSDCLLKIDMSNNAIVWTLGSRQSDFHFFDIDGNFLDANKRLKNAFYKDPVQTVYGTFQHQHKFQHLTDEYYSLFDNNMCSEAALIRFCTKDTSRFVILHLDATQFTANEVYSWSTGDQAMLNGGADVLPSGNILGNSYHKTVYPENEDFQFHVNMWEATSSGDIAWRASFKGWNPWDPEDETSPYSHSVTPGEEPPVGWVIYSVERIYDKPVVSQVCMSSNEPNKRSVRLTVFNTIRTQEDMPGSVHMYNTADQTLLSKSEFLYQKSFFPVDVQVAIPEENYSSDISLMVVNSWEDARLVLPGKLSELIACSDLPPSTRIFPAPPTPAKK